MNQPHQHPHHPKPGEDFDRLIDDVPTKGKTPEPEPASPYEQDDDDGAALP